MARQKKIPFKEFPRLKIMIPSAVDYAAKNNGCGCK